MVAHTPLLYGLYTKAGEIDLDAYDTLYNRKKLKKLLTEENQPISWVLKYITEQFGGSVVLSTTANKKHMLENMQYIG
jgi:predicted aldo/keto reductase-like oxidoreductase